MASNFRKSAKQGSEPGDKTDPEHFTYKIPAMGDNLILPVLRAPVAQLDRADASGASGREFESLRAHHSFDLALWKIRSKGFLYEG